MHKTISLKNKIAFLRTTVIFSISMNYLGRYLADTYDHQSNISKKSWCCTKAYYTWKLHESSLKTKFKGILRNISRIFVKFLFFFKHSCYVCQHGNNRICERKLESMFTINYVKLLEHDWLSNLQWSHKFPRYSAKLSNNDQSLLYKKLQI